MLRVEFHCHTIYSEDSLTKPEDLVVACRDKKIDRIVITDHNTTAGALEAYQLDPELVIIGEEVMTCAGELLAAFVQEEVPPDLEPLQAVELLRRQGAFISVSHPFDQMRKPWQPEILNSILPYLDGIEVFNARVIWPGYNQRARRYAREYGLPELSGSDAHTISELGAATLLLDNFIDAASLREVVRRARPRNRYSCPWVHFASRRAVKTKKEWQKD